MDELMKNIENPKILESIFGDEEIDISKVNIHEIGLSIDGPTVSIRFDLDRFPANPPKKWIDQDFNTVQVKVLLIGATNLNISNLQTRYLAKIRIEKHGSFFIFEGIGNKANFKINCEFISIESVSAYQDESKNDF